MFTHTRAAIAAPRRTAALPVSVRRNSRSGVSRFRAQAVRPENGSRGDDAVIAAYSTRVKRSSRGGRATERAAPARRHFACGGPRRAPGDEAAPVGIFDPCRLGCLEE